LTDIDVFGAIFRTFTLTLLVERLALNPCSTNSVKAYVMSFPSLEVAENCAIFSNLIVDKIMIAYQLLTLLKNLI
jgi:hypothetical protein